MNSTAVLFVLNAAANGDAAANPASAARSGAAAVRQGSDSALIRAQMLPHRLDAAGMRQPTVAAAETHPFYRKGGLCGSYGSRTSVAVSR